MGCKACKAVETRPVYMYPPPGYGAHPYPYGEAPYREAQGYQGPAPSAGRFVDRGGGGGLFPVDERLTMRSPLAQQRDPYGPAGASPAAVVVPTTAPYGGEASGGGGGRWRVAPDTSYPPAPEPVRFGFTAAGTTGGGGGGRQALPMSATAPVGYGGGGGLRASQLPANVRHQSATPKRVEFSGGGGGGGSLARTATTGGNVGARHSGAGGSGMERRASSGGGADEMVLVCADCYADITDPRTPAKCRVSGKLHA